MIEFDIAEKLLLGNYKYKVFYKCERFVKYPKNHKRF